MKWIKNVNRMNRVSKLYFAIYNKTCKSYAKKNYRIVKKYLYIKNDVKNE